jgi:hypothetical protein
MSNRVVLAVLACLLGCGVVRGQGDPKAVELTPPKKKYAQEYSQPFTGKTENIPGWEVLNSGAEQNVRFEAAGLRITLPPGLAGGHPVTGLITGFGVQGDFEITLSFEIIKEADEGTNRTVLDLVITKDVPKADVATIGRLMSPKDGRRFIGWSSMWDNVTEKKVPHPISRPTKAMTGRLRLVRSGADLHYGFSEEFDGYFRYFKRFPFGPEDLRRVRIVGATGGDKATLDVRVTDFRIRADSIPNMPAAVPVPAAVVPQAAVPQADALTAPAGRGWLMAALLIGTALILVSAVALGVAFLLLRRRAVQAPAAKQNGKNKR